MAIFLLVCIKISLGFSFEENFGVFKKWEVWENFSKVFIFSSGRFWQGGNYQHSIFTSEGDFRGALRRKIGFSVFRAIRLEV